MDGERLRRGGVVEVRRDAVQDRMRRLVGDDVRRQAGVDLRVLLFRVLEEKELQAAGIAVVEGVAHDACARHDHQLLARERPAQFPPEHIVFLEHVDHFHDRAEDADLQEVGTVAVVLILDCVAADLLALRRAQERRAGVDRAVVRIDVDDRQAPRHWPVEQRLVGLIFKTFEKGFVHGLRCSRLDRHVVQLDLCLHRLGVSHLQLLLGR